MAYHVPTLANDFYVLLSCFPHGLSLEINDFNSGIDRISSFNLHIMAFLYAITRMLDYSSMSGLDSTNQSACAMSFLPNILSYATF